MLGQQFEDPSAVSEAAAVLRSERLITKEHRQSA